MLHHCDEHDDCKVVYAAPRHGAPCPVCTEIANLKKDKGYLEEDLQKVTGERDDLQQKLDEKE